VESKGRKLLFRGFI